MTDIELLDIEKIGVAAAAKYLQNGTTAQQIRVWAQHGTCPFCQCYKIRGRTHFNYRIHVGNLIAYKNGEKTVPMPRLGYGGF